MTFMRVTRDQRGYETTFLLHVPRPGDRARVLYWYRTAPGVRVGRIALDEDAIRLIEEQHPEIEFDWPALLEEAESVPPEVQRRPERPRRKPRPQEPVTAPAVAVASPTLGDAGREEPPDIPVPAAPSVADAPGAPSAPSAPRVPSVPAAAVSSVPRNALLDSLVGREIAARLRLRYSEIASRLGEISTPRNDWQARADALNPDRWVTPQAILDGVQRADRLFDELKRELTDAPGDEPSSSEQS